MLEMNTQSVMVTGISCARTGVSRRIVISSQDPNSEVNSNVASQMNEMSVH
jgi:hypothetical protein